MIHFAFITCISHNSQLEFANKFKARIQAQAKRAEGAEVEEARAILARLGMPSFKRTRMRYLHCQLMKLNCGACEPKSRPSSSAFDEIRGGAMNMMNGLIDQGHILNRFESNG
jgi:hypothetical protein